VAKDSWKDVPGHISYNRVPSYCSNPTLYQFDKVQFSGVLNESGDQIELTALITNFNPDGTQKGDSFSDTANGVRIALEVLPNTTHSLRLPEHP